MTLPGRDVARSPRVAGPSEASARLGSGSLRGQIRDRRTKAVAGRSESSVALAGQRRVAGTELQERAALGSRLRDYVSRRENSVTTRGTLASPLRDDPVSRLRRPQIVYRDRPALVTHKPHHVYTYRDRYDRLCHRIIWPRYHYPLLYTYGPHVTFGCVFPYYHRKHVFVSLGGYWPWDYSYVRYYWYGWHPYVWQGYYPVPREVAAQNNNYYTYNYYTGADGSYTSDTYYGSGENQVAYADQTTFADMRAKLEKQAAQPAEQTLADTRFEEGVKSFESGDYGTAAAKFGVAMKLAPEDAILPFAYAQALFAHGRYSESAEALRAALKSVSPEKEGVFYPRGLYPSDDVLFGEIEQLLDKLEQYGYDADLQLLLGYHLLGIGETEYARRPLEQARGDLRNAEAAGTLLGLLAKMEVDTVSKNSGGASEVGTAEGPQVSDIGVAKEAQPALKTETPEVSPGLSERLKANAQRDASDGKPKDTGGANVIEETGSATEDKTEPGPGAAGAGSQLEAGRVDTGTGQPPARKEDDDGIQSVQRNNIAPGRN